MSKKISLKQFLMKTGKFEKVYDCISAIKEGKIIVGQKIVTNPNYFFNPKTLVVKLNNEKIKQSAKLYFLMNKPPGYLSQKSSGEKTIYDLIEKLSIPEESKKSLFAVGRLDKDTEGLMILTNDGKLAYSLMSPDSKIEKTYHAILQNPVKKTELEKLENGIRIKIENVEYMTKPAKIQIISKKSVYITIVEGRKRQIRKMFEMVGNKVDYLKRVSIGGLQLGSMETGDIKPISREEIYEKLFVQ